MDVITFNEVRVGDTIEVEDAGKTYPAKVTSIRHDGGDFLPVSVKVGLLTSAYDHDRDDAVILLDRAAEG